VGFANNIFIKFRPPGLAIAVTSCLGQFFGYTHRRCDRIVKTAYFRQYFSKGIQDEGIAIFELLSSLEPVAMGERARQEREVPSGGRTFNKVVTAWAARRHG
jgi:hypothetical protein